MVAWFSLPIHRAIVKKQTRRAVLAKDPAFSCGTCVDSEAGSNPVASQNLELQFDAAHEAVEGQRVAHAGEIVGLHRADEVIGADDVEPAAERVAGREPQLVVPERPADTQLGVDDRHHAVGGKTGIDQGAARPLVCV